jgi:hypothetical protein
VSRGARLDSIACKTSCAAGIARIVNTSVHPVPGFADRNILAVLVGMSLFAAHVILFKKRQRIFHPGNVVHLSILKYLSFLIFKLNLIIYLI